MLWHWNVVYDKGGGGAVRKQGSNCAVLDAQYTMIWMKWGHATGNSPQTLSAAGSTYTLLSQSGLLPCVSASHAGSTATETAKARSASWFRLRVRKLL